MVNRNYAEEFSYRLFRGDNHNGRPTQRELVDRGSVFINCDSRVPELIRYEVIGDAVLMLKRGVEGAIVKTENYIARLKRGKAIFFGGCYGTQIDAEVFYDSGRENQGEQRRAGKANLSFLVNSSLVNSLVAERN